MKTKEIISEVNWKRLAKQATNVAIKTGDAMMGVSGTKGFDMTKNTKKDAYDKKHTKEIVRLAREFNKKWKEVAQNYRYEDTTNLTATELVRYLDKVIQGLFEVNTADASIAPIIKEIALLTRNEIKNDNTQFDDNIKIQQRVLRLISTALDLQSDSVIDDEQGIDALYVRINVRDSRNNRIEAFYFSFKGKINEFFRYDILPDTDPTQLKRMAKVTDSFTKRKIRDESPSPIVVKDVSEDGDMKIIEDMSGTISGTY